MPLPWPEIRDKAIAFSREWKDTDRTFTQALDRVVDASYGRKNFVSDAERVAFLFELYQKYTSLLPSQAKASKP